VNRTAVDLFGVSVITIRPRVLVCLIDDEMEEPSDMYRTLFIACVEGVIEYWMMARVQLNKVRA
jgi:hypothetical protein